MTLAVDISNYTVNFNAEALAEAGVKRVVVQLVNERTLSHRDQIPALIAAVQSTSSNGLIAALLVGTFVAIEAGQAWRAAFTGSLNRSTCGSMTQLV